MRRECDDSLEDLMIVDSSDELYLSHLILMPKKLGTRDCQKSLISSRYAADNCDGFRIWLKTKSEIDRLLKTQRRCNTGHPLRPHLLPIQVSFSNCVKDNRHAWKYLVAILHRELKR